ncbi:MAG TPA: RnfABCDGE type electron transport complex subunit D [Candidatus Rifleibacterium sp.]|nr:RnfABCDGE type electron transport complex subunit D [Candidatus Rifleibacterium sp.]HPT48299.1 RnfABCDGE type electron transport complex subunit D [Candidatus Rifleibacterium sp.]
MSAITASNTAAVPRLLVTSSPHIQSGLSSARVMWDVNLALLPALVMALYNFGLRAALVVACSVLGAVTAEFLILKFLRGKPCALADGSAVVTGILLAFCVPVALPLWIAFIGGFVAIAIGKQVYGGLGQNIFNPAHVARAMLLTSWPVYMTTWLKPGMSSGISCADAITAATPLGLLKETAGNSELMTQLSTSGTTIVGHVFQKLQITFADLFLGVNFAGSLGEVSKIALLIGGVYLLLKGHITWHAPVAMAATVFIGAFIYGGSFEYALFHLLTGGLTIGALFMVTDMVTSPMTSNGHLLFGFGCGAITLLIRLKGGYPEGVCYSILIMNAFVPLIDKFFVPKRFGSSQEATS